MASSKCNLAGLFLTKKINKTIGKRKKKRKGRNKRREGRGGEGTEEEEMEGKERGREGEEERKYDGEGRKQRRGRKEVGIVPCTLRVSHEQTTQ